MANYDLFAKHYDILMDDTTDKAKRIENYIKSYHPQAKSLLEIACGTGSILKSMPEKFDKSGLDFSKGMLKEARRKLKSVKFYHQNMVSFKLNKKFDVIICVFDAINHLLSLDEWVKLFNTAHDHLTEEGLLIFDVNTPYRLERLSKQGTVIKRFEENNVFMLSVIKTENGCYNWVAEIFEHQRNGRFTYYKESIPEKGFPLKQIKKTLQTQFQMERIEDDEVKQPSRYSERIWFICRKRNI